MRDHRISKELESVLRGFEDCFSNRSYVNFVSLVIGWVMSVGRRTVSRVAMASGARFFGAGMHHDGANSSSGGANGPSPCFAFGHNWVVLAVKLPLPWGDRKAVAVPVLLRLYRSKRLCPEEAYVKRTQLAREMLEKAREIVPAEKRLRLAGDSEYACQTLLLDLPPGIEFTGPIHMDAALHGAVKKNSGKGRPRKKGARESSPRERFGRRGGSWKSVKVDIYGRSVRLQVKVSVTRWTKALGARPVKLILTRDPSGRFKDRAYFTTDLKASMGTILQRMAGRWPIEVSFRDLKQLFGMGDAQNGWGRGKQRRKITAGSDPLGNKGEHAIRRTAPLACFVYAIVIVTYVRMDRADADVEAARNAAPWYTKKSEPSVVDMLAALRRDLLARRLSAHPEDRSARAKILRLLPWDLMAAA